MELMFLTPNLMQPIHFWLLYSICSFSDLLLGFTPNSYCDYSWRDTRARPGGLAEVGLTTQHVHACA